MYRTTLWRLLSRACMTHAVRYAVGFDPSLQLCVMPMALSPSLQLPLLGSRKHDIVFTGRNRCGSDPLRVTPLNRDTPFASMPAKAMPGIAAPHNTVVSVCPSGPCLAHIE